MPPSGARFPGDRLVWPCLGSKLKGSEEEVGSVGITAEDFDLHLDDGKMMIRDISRILNRDEAEILRELDKYGLDRGDGVRVPLMDAAVIFRLYGVMLELNSGFSQQVEDLVNSASGESHQTTVSKGSPEETCKDVELDLTEGQAGEDKDHEFKQESDEEVNARLDPIPFKELAERVGLKEYQLLAELVKMKTRATSVQSIKPHIARAICEKHNVPFE
ncbi:hypothetical protein N9965_01430 [bacterium]|nr:hypothetical protein [bacterium]